MQRLPVLVDLRNAYEAHDRDAFERLLDRLQALITSIGRTPIAFLTATALEHRRAEVAADLNALDAEIQRRQQPSD